MGRINEENEKEKEKKDRFDFGKNLFPFSIFTHMSPKRAETKISE
jgi:hypothetical protein